MLKGGPAVAGLLWEFKSNYRVSVKRRVAVGAEVGVYLFFLKNTVLRLGLGLREG